jgi:hypothetical protein
MASAEQAVTNFYRKIVGWSVFIQVLSAVTLWLFAWGTITLLLRLTTSTSNSILLWGAVGFPIAAGAALWLARRRYPDLTAIRAYLDSSGNCGGMLMAAAERKLPGWKVPVPKSLPELRWNGGRPLALLAIAVSYVLLCFLVPINPQFLSSSQLDLSRETERIAQKLQVLKEEKILDAERAENLKQKLAQIRDQAAGKDPAKSLEALDQLNDILRKAAHKAAENAAKEGAALNKLETAAEALQQITAELEPSENAKLMKDLASMAQKAAEESENLKDELDQDLANDIAGGKVSPNNMSKLGAAAHGASDKVKRLAKNLHNSKLIDADQLKNCEGQCKGGAKELADYLKKNIGKSGLSEAMDDLGGKGGTDDGPGASALTFGEKSSSEGAKFREEALPPGSLASLKESEMVGVSAAKPRNDKQTGTPGSGGLQNAAAGGGSANAAVVLPQHRGAVERYFERNKK